MMNSIETKEHDQDKIKEELFAWKKVSPVEIVMLA